MNVMGIVAHSAFPSTTPEVFVGDKQSIPLRPSKEVSLALNIREALSLQREMQNVSFQVHIIVSVAESANQSIRKLQSAAGG